MMKTEIQSLVSKLADLKSYKTPLKNRVIETILNQIDSQETCTDKDLKTWFEDLERGGCESGFIGSLCYYSDTHKFYDDFYEGIEDLIHEWEQETGERVNTKKSGDDRKNYLAWFAFESVAADLAREIGIEYE